MSEPLLADLLSRLSFNESEGRIWLDEHRMMLMHGSSFGALREELIKSLGYQRAFALLFRMGQMSGKRDAALVQHIRPNVDITESFMIGPLLHGLEGMVNVEKISLRLDPEAKEFDGEFLWQNSIEAEEHKRAFGPSEHPVCWNQIGYASGYTSAVMGVPIFFKEVECAAKGGGVCRIRGRPLIEWPDSRQIEEIIEIGPIAEELYSLQEQISQGQSINLIARNEDLVARSPVTKGCLEQVRKAAAVDVTVLLHGPTGVGKEVFSHELHRNSARADKPFLAVNCAALPHELVEAELFGVEKGAYTGAQRSRPGRFERAHGGTLFLDEIAELPLAAQSKLLRVLQSGEYERVGGDQVLTSNVRLITATNRNLEEMVDEGRFRADLLYRINVFPISVPPLSDRVEDIGPLTEHFIRKFNARYGAGVIGITDRALALLVDHSWPGNVRQLENTIERAVILCATGEEISIEHLRLEEAVINGELKFADGEMKFIDGELSQVDSMGALVSTIMEDSISFEVLERNVLEAALRKSGGNHAQAARLLSMGDAQFRYRTKKHGIDT